MIIIAHIIVIITITITITMTPIMTIVSVRPMTVGTVVVEEWR